MRAHARTLPPKKESDAFSPERIPAPMKAGVYSKTQPQDSAAMMPSHPQVYSHQKTWWSHRMPGA